MKLNVHFIDKAEIEWDWTDSCLIIYFLLWKCLKLRYVVTNEINYLQRCYFWSHEMQWSGFYIFKFLQFQTSIFLRSKCLFSTIILQWWWNAPLVVNSSSFIIYHWALTIHSDTKQLHPLLRFSHFIQNSLELCGEWVTIRVLLEFRSNFCLRYQKTIQWNTLISSFTESNIHIPAVHS